MNQSFLINQALLIVKKCYKVLLSKYKSKNFFKSSDEIKANSEHWTITYGNKNLLDNYFTIKSNDGQNFNVGLSMQTKHQIIKDCVCKKIPSYCVFLMILHKHCE